MRRDSGHGISLAQPGRMGISITLCSLVYALASLMAVVSAMRRIPRLRDFEPGPLARWPRVSLIVPARDEAADLEPAILSRLADGYPELEVIIGIEEVWNKFLLSPLELNKYVDEFASPWVRAYVDVGNMVFYGYPQDWIRTVAKRTVRVHLKDFQLDRPNGRFYWKNLGEKGNYASFIVYYHPTMRLTGRGEAFRKKYIAEFKEDPIYGALNGYAQVVLLADALNAAKSDNTDALVKALLAGKFEGWNGTISFTRGEGPYWQQWSPPMLVIQYTKPEMPFADAKIIYPPDLKTGDWVAAPKR